MSNQEEPVGSPEEQIGVLFSQLQAEGNRIARAAERKESPNVVLAMQAIRATEIREELREVVFSEDVSNEDWAAWALMNLSPYSNADILSLADLTITRHNIKTLFRMEGF